MVPITAVKKRRRRADRTAPPHLRQGDLSWFDHHVDADMDAGAHAIGGAELGDPHEHVDAQFLRPGQVDREQDRIKEGNADEIAVHHGDEDDRRRQRHQRRDQDLLSRSRIRRTVASPPQRWARARDAVRRTVSSAAHAPSIHALLPPRPDVDGRPSPADDRAPQPLQHAGYEERRPQSCF